MKMIAPITMTDGQLVSSDVPEDDAPVWAAGTTYGDGAEVMLDHRVYRSAVAGNSGNDPRTDDGTNWIDLYATNRWKAFDKLVSDPVQQVEKITYRITPAEAVGAVAFVNLGAYRARVQVFSASGQRLYDKEQFIGGISAIYDYWTFFTVDLSLSIMQEMVFANIPGYPGNEILIELFAETASATVSVGQIITGPSYTLGITMSGTATGIKDFSTKDRNQFGDSIIVERAFADTTSYQFALPSRTAHNVKRLLSKQRATPSYYYVSEDAMEFGAQVYGFFQDFEIPLNAGGTSYANLKIEGLT
ncbi:hypothetical protein [Pontibaca salina]|uniref:Uncharacterized protein n=1 Tax=Pontibaca salina TaxID=2795731 RepID=A0A934M055_9RHOB|nr:hypothetical protein [Pontibaca salina]MBI6628316.1 hypothetical protein [Pontibaca salina]